MRRDPAIFGATPLALLVAKGPVVPTVRPAVVIHAMA